MRLQGQTISHSVIKTTKHSLVKIPNIPLFMLISFQDITFLSYIDHFAGWSQLELLILYLYLDITPFHTHIYCVHRNRWISV